MSLTTLPPDVSRWQKVRTETVRVEGVSTPGVERTVYRFKSPAMSEQYTCAHYTLRGQTIMRVWGIAGAADCCRFHDVCEGPVAAGPPIVRYDPARRTLTIDAHTFSL